MAYKQTIVGVTVTPYERATLDQLAAAKGMKPSTLAKLYITKGLEADRPNGTAQDLVDSGFCPDLDEANKLLRFLGKGQ